MIGNLFFVSFDFGTICDFFFDGRRLLSGNRIACFGRCFTIHSGNGRLEFDFLVMSGFFDNKNNIHLRMDLGDSILVLDFQPGFSFPPDSDLFSSSRLEMTLSCK
jgi:hypothetical protein